MSGLLVIGKVTDELLTHFLSSVKDDIDVPRKQAQAVVP